jgi:hypothetical protein
VPRLIHAFFKGVLACLDGYMNIAMEQTEEYVNGQLKNKYGDCFIRGNNGNCCATFVASEARFNQCPMTTTVPNTPSAVHQHPAQKELSGSSWRAHRTRV